MAVNNDVVTLAAPELRYMVSDYVMIGDAYELAGTGFSKLDENYGAQESSKAYISDKNTTTTVKYYEREFPYECDLISSSKVVKAFKDVGELGQTGTDAMFDYVRVNLYEPKETTESNKSFFARRFIVTCVPDSSAGEGASEITMSGTLKVVGDPEVGYFDISTKKFTKNGVSA